MGKRRYLFWMYSIFIGVALIVFTFLVPPFRKFDETYHFLRLMTIVGGQFSCKAGVAGSEPYFLLPKRVVGFVDTFTNGITEKFPISLLKQSYPFHGDTETVKTYECYLPYAGYIPQTLGALVSAPWNNLLVTFYFARIGAAIFFLTCFILSLRFCPKRYLAVLMLVGVFPTVLHQVTIVSYDATIISLSFVVFALFTRYLDAKKISFSSFVLFCLVIAYFVLAKPGYYAFALLPLFLIRKINTSLSKSMLVLIAVLCCVLGITYFIHIRIGELSDSMYLRYQLSVTNPGYFLRVLYHSITTLQGVYLSGILTTLGWFEYDLPVSIAVIYLCLLGFVGYRTILHEKKIVSLGWAVALLGSVIASILLLFYLFFVYATPVGKTTITGIQGRYFLPFILFGFLAISQIIVNLGSRKSACIGLGLVGAYLLYSITLTIYTRYYDYTGLVTRDTRNEQATLSFTGLPINAPLQQLYPADVGNKIGGFQLILENEKDSTVSAAYSYSIKDSSCRMTLREGYLDQERTEVNGMYSEYFSPFTVRERALCVEIVPLALRHTPIFLTVASDAQHVPLLYFLYQLK